MGKTNALFQEERRAKGLQLFKENAEKNLEELENNLKELADAISKKEADIHESEEDRIKFKKLINEYSIIRAFTDLVDGKQENITQYVKDIMLKNKCLQIAGWSYKKSKDGDKFSQDLAKKIIEDIKKELKSSKSDADKLNSITKLANSSYTIKTEGSYRFVEIADELTEFESTEEVTEEEKK